MKIEDNIIKYLNYEFVYENKRYYIVDNWMNEIYANKTYRVPLLRAVLNPSELKILKKIKNKFREDKLNRILND